MGMYWGKVKRLISQGLAARVVVVFVLLWLWLVLVVLLSLLALFSPCSKSAGDGEAVSVPADACRWDNGAMGFLAGVQLSAVPLLCPCMYARTGDCTCAYGECAGLKLLPRAGDGLHETEPV